jgi:hypothetical protein
VGGVGDNMWSQLLNYWHTNLAPAVDYNVSWNCDLCQTLRVQDYFDKMLPQIIDTARFNNGTFYDETALTNQPNFSVLGERRKKIIELKNIRFFRRKRD